MKFILITQDVWVNLEDVEAVTRDKQDGTALIQGRSRVWKSIIPFEAVISAIQEDETQAPQQQNVLSPLVSIPTYECWPLNQLPCLP